MTGKPMTIQVAPCRSRRSSAELQPDLKQLVESWWEITQLHAMGYGDDWDLAQDCFVKLGFTFTKFTKVEISSEKKTIGTSAAAARVRVKWLCQTCPWTWGSPVTMRKELMRCFTAGASAVGWNHQAETVATGVVPFFPQQRMWLLIKSSGLRWFQHVSTSACIVCVCSITSIIVYLLRIGKSLSFFRVELNSTCKYSRSEIASWKLDNPQAVRRFPSWLWVEGSSSVAMVAFPFRLRFFYGKLLINAGLPIAMLPCLITRGYISAEIAVLSSRTGPCSPVNCSGDVSKVHRHQAQLGSHVAWAIWSVWLWKRAIPRYNWYTIKIVIWRGTVVINQGIWIWGYHVLDETVEWLTLLAFRTYKRIFF